MSRSPIPVDPYLINFDKSAWITLIMAALFGCIGLVLIPETSASRILQIKAKHLRYQTKNWALHAKADESRVDFNSITTVYLVRPFVMFVQEPILALVTAYMSFIYGVLYLLFEAYPISFQEERGWNPGVGSLPFAAFIVGIMMGTGMIAYSTRTNFTRAYRKYGKVVRRKGCRDDCWCGSASSCAVLICLVRSSHLTTNYSFVSPLTLDILRTSNPHITWVPQVIATALLGMGCLVTCTAPPLPPVAVFHH